LFEFTRTDDAKERQNINDGVMGCPPFFKSAQWHLKQRFD
jgi:hypothetical protein